VLVAGLVAVLVAGGLSLSGLLDRFEDGSVDLRFGVRDVPAPTDIVVVGIDEASIERVGVWPFRRVKHAQVVDRLRRAGARAIVYDVQFTEPSPRPEDDLALFDALDRAGGAILATGTSDARGRTNVLGGDENLAEINSRAAAANLPSDHGGVIRRYPRRVVRLDSMATATAARLTGRELRASAFDERGEARIDYRGPPGTFPAYAFADVLDGRVPERALQGKIVIVGATAATLQDAHATPTSGSSQMSGPEVEANAIWTALHGNPLRDAPGWIGLACLVLLGLVVPLLRLRLGLAGTLICAAALAAAAVVGAQLAFERGWIVPLVAPLLALGLGTLGTVAAGYAAEYSVRRSMTRYSARLEAEVAARTEELRETQVEVITRLSQAAESRHEETGAHLERMSRLCARLGLAAGLSEREAEELRLAALLHDVGKIGIPDAILGKPGELTEEEWDVMRAHTAVGAAILAGSRSSLIQTAEVIARTHHERWNGTGYPQGLRGEEIPLAGRIAAVCDVFDALITPRSYKPAWSLDRVLAHLTDERGRHFDPALVDLFLPLAEQMRDELAASDEERRELAPARER
jgi:CHASE2 domain-containing sensor protein